MRLRKSHLLEVTLTGIRAGAFLKRPTLTSTVLPVPGGMSLAEAVTYGHFNLDRSTKIGMSLSTLSFMIDCQCQCHDSRLALDLHCQCHHLVTDSDIESDTVTVSHTSCLVTCVTNTVSLLA